MDDIKSIRSALEFLRALELKSALDINNPTPEVPYRSEEALNALARLAHHVKEMEGTTEAMRNSFGEDEEWKSGNLAGDLP